MKQIIITSTVYCEQIQVFDVTDEVYENYVSRLENLEIDENQEELIQLYIDLEEDAEQVDDYMLSQLDAPEIINNITL
jgi:hypothetical protein